MVNQIKIYQLIINLMKGGIKDDGRKKKIKN